ncbi:MAG: hypothetical protein F6J93_38525 [Oscillatoria sp. SIO1A7]|nr:hypothetical protein [Oscillatoria sp. SIO1A7]
MPLQILGIDSLRKSCSEVRKYQSTKVSVLVSPSLQCPMPNAQCPMPHAQCPMPNALE